MAGPDLPSPQGSDQADAPVTETPSGRRAVLGDAIIAVDATTPSRWLHRDCPRQDLTLVRLRRVRRCRWRETY